MEKRIIGQGVVLSELDKIFKIFVNSKCHIKPHFFLTGSSGTGKTRMMEYLASKHKTQFLSINAAQVTKEGVVGASLSKLLVPLGQFDSKEPVVVFVDEFDKLFIAGNLNSERAKPETSEVQSEFLKILEGGSTSVMGDYGKYNTIPLKNVLFVFAGAFNGEDDLNIKKLQEYGVKTEFLGRVGLIYQTRNLDLDELYEVLETSELLDQYLNLFEDAERERVIAELKIEIEQRYTHNTIGARLIPSLVHQYFIKGGIRESDPKVISFEKKMTLEK